MTVVNAPLLARHFRLAAQERREGAIDALRDGRARLAGEREQVLAGLPAGDERERAVVWYRAIDRYFAAWLDLYDALPDQGPD